MEWGRGKKGEDKRTKSSESIQKEREKNGKQGASKWPVGLCRKKTNKIYKAEAEAEADSFTLFLAIFGIHAAKGVGNSCLSYASVPSW